MTDSPLMLKILILAAVLAPFSVWYEPKWEEQVEEPFHAHHFDDLEVGCKEIAAQPLSSPIKVIRKRKTKPLIVPTGGAMTACHWRLDDKTWINSRHF